MDFITAKASSAAGAQHALLICILHADQEKVRTAAVARHRLCLCLMPVSLLTSLLLCLLSLVQLNSLVSLLNDSHLTPHVTPLSQLPIHVDSATLTKVSSCDAMR